MNIENKEFAAENEGMEEKLWQYIDGSVSEAERSFIEQLIRAEQRWKEKYHELLEIHQLMQSSELESPSMRFTKNVMEEIARYHIAPAAKTYIDKKVIWGIAIFFFTLIAAFLIYGFGQIDWSSSQSGSVDRFINNNLDKVDYSRFFNNTYITVFMMLNVILGLMLLDRYLANKRKKHMKEA